MPILTNNQRHASMWRREPGIPRKSPSLSDSAIRDAAERFRRFEPVLAVLFGDDAWDGQVASPLLDFRAEWGWLVKADHLLPMTGTVKARGGVHELLMRIEMLATQAGIIRPDVEYLALLDPEARNLLASQKVVVASTGNLGFSIGLVARRFGLSTEVHMSRDAKEWKKQRLRDTGAAVIEHDCDYEQAVARARIAAGSDGYFIDDERSPHLFHGYATAAVEIAAQIDALGIVVDRENPLAVFLPCGVGGAPGGITAGLRSIYGNALIAVFVEPVASACFFVAMAENYGHAASVYDFGLDNGTIADGLAVPRASELVLELIQDDIDAVMALPDAMMRAWVRQAWAEKGLKLEPAAAAAMAAAELFPAMVAADTDSAAEINWCAATRVAWTTGGSLMPDEVFLDLLDPDLATA